MGIKLNKKSQPKLKGNFKFHAKSKNATRISKKGFLPALSKTKKSAGLRIKVNTPKKLKGNFGPKLKLHKKKEANLSGNFGLKVHKKAHANLKGDFKAHSKSKKETRISKKG